MYQMFKGYVKTRNKKCIEPFKGKSSDELHTLREVQGLDEFAGILNDDTVLIDVDDTEQSETLMQIVEERQIACLVYQTTRGKHFLFLNDGRLGKNKTKCRLACGLTCDIKLGSRTSYSVLKYGGVEREILYDIFPDEEYVPVPKWLLPVKSKINFNSLGEGDGRNQGLFNYILTLQSAGFSKDESRETIKIINKYILKKPLDGRELQTILRDDAFQLPVFFDGKTFLHERFAEFLISEYSIKRINGALHYFKDGCYVPGNLETIMIKHIPNLKQQQRNEVKGYLRAKLDVNTVPSPAQYIAFKNGVYNLETGCLEAFSAERILTNLIPWDYNKNAYSQTVEDVLNRLACGDTKVRQLLDEVIGYTFYRRNELRKAFMLKGKRHNGKSTFLDMLAHLLGEENISSLDLADLSHEYKAAGLFGKLANLGDDIEDEFIPSAGTFKKVVSGDRMNVNVKFEKPIEFNPYCKLIFSGNTIPRLGRGRDSAAIIDRLIIVPFNAEFNKDTPGFSPFIKYQLREPECMEHLIQIGLEGLKRVLERNEFTTTDDIEKELELYEKTIDPIQIFFDEIGDTFENEPTKKCYRRYSEFCLENAMKPISNVEFTKRVKEHFGYDNTVIRVKGRPTRIFVKKGVKG